MNSIHCKNYDKDACNDKNCLTCKYSHENGFEVFMQRFVAEQEDLDPKISEMVDKEFWNLVDTTDTTNGVETTRTSDPYVEGIMNKLDNEDNHAEKQTMTLTFLQHSSELRDDITRHTIESAISRLKAVIDCHSVILYEDAICHVVHLLSSRILDNHSKHYNHDMTQLYDNYNYTRDVSYRDKGQWSREKVDSARNTAQQLVYDMIDELEQYLETLQDDVSIKHILDELYEKVEELESMYSHTTDPDLKHLKGLIQKQDVLDLIQSYR